MAIIETKKLTREFSSFSAVDSFDIAIEEGDGYALL